MWGNIPFCENPPLFAEDSDGGFRLPEPRSAPDFFMIIHRRYPTLPRRYLCPAHPSITAGRQVLLLPFDNKNEQEKTK